ncbi:glycosyltransferase family 4 protein [Streptomyces cavernae]|uniref:glycosyltransferase family 4 protein n=1 Tax=Streptomyces cavernae TaxID=2259034 RepID=UPI000FEC0F83|nr:glycosyltransferase family 4 protein [Streptomyces cavernae]
MTAQAADHGILFYPRGGSSLVVKYLTEHLRAAGRPARVFAGSLGAPGLYSHAWTFYDPAHLVVSDYSPAVAAHTTGQDPLLEPVPLHPSYEDRGDVPDRLFSAVSPRTNALVEDYWTRQFAAHDAGAGGLLHLHHLTPQHAAARRLDRTVVTTLHGTEIKFLAAAQRRIRLAAAHGLTVAELGHRFRTNPRALLSLIGRRDEAAARDAEQLLRDRWDNWIHADFWTRTLREHAHSSERIIVISEQDRILAQSLLHVPDDRLEIIPNGVDTVRFRPGPTLSDTEKRTLLHRWLVENPQGWLPHQGPGTLAYTQSDVDRMLRDSNGRPRPLLLWMGRFLAFKHLDLLLHSFAALRQSAPVRPALLVLGGYPGEWEGEHPHTLASRLGINDDVYFAGWRPHNDLIDGLRACDLFTAPSVNEPFGLVYLEAMASGTPVVASASGGPLGFVRPGGPRPTGWLPAPGDADDLHATLLGALTHPEEIARRGRNARDFVVRHYSWQTITDRYAQMYDRVQARARA